MQEPSKALMPKLPTDPEEILLCEIYLSLQGEGVDMGRPTVFVRTTGCPMRCRWCDSEYSFFDGSIVRINDVINSVEKYRAHDVCVTGGEPLAQTQVGTLVRRLLGRGYRVVVETGGSQSIEVLPSSRDLCISLDVKCPSSGMHERQKWTNLKHLKPRDQLKFVIADRADYEYAKAVLSRYSLACPVVFQPEGGKKLRPLAEWVLEDGIDVRVLPQLHKWIWGKKRGV